MRALVQRVSQAKVTVNETTIGEIDLGLVVLLGVSRTDTIELAGKLANKVLSLRVFADEAGKMNRNVLESSGGLLIVSQFTLYADTRKGNRPSFVEAADPKLAGELYEAFVRFCRERCPNTSTGKFQAHMALSLVNDGPVTILLDSELKND